MVFHYVLILIMLKWILILYIKRLNLRKSKRPRVRKKSSETAEEQHTDVPINSNDDLSDEVSISSTTSSKSSRPKVRFKDQTKD